MVQPWSHEVQAIVSLSGHLTAERSALDVCINHVDLYHAQDRLSWCKVTPTSQSFPQAPICMLHEEIFDVTSIRETPHVNLATWCRANS